MEPRLRQFWIKAQLESNPLGYGITAFSLDDAIAIIRQCGIEFQLESDQYDVTENINFDDLDHHVQCNMGPMNVRGLWFPFSHGIGITDRK